MQRKKIVTENGSYKVILQNADAPIMDQKENLFCTAVFDKEQENSPKQ